VAQTLGWVFVTLAMQTKLQGRPFAHFRAGLSCLKGRHFTNFRVGPFWPLKGRSLACEHRV
jgi:hypothetical protein